MSTQMDDEHGPFWAVHVKVRAGSVEVYPQLDKGYEIEWAPGWSTRRSVPSYARNFERKLAKIKERCQRWCDNQNRMERVVQEAHTQDPTAQ